MSDAGPQFSRLTDHAVIAISGRDARAFLHAQLTQDINAVSADRGTLAAWADARGRVRALFYVVPTAERRLLVTSADLVGVLLPKLRMFVLRADVALAHEETLSVAAIVGDAIAWARGERIDLPRAAYALRLAREVFWLRLGPDLLYAIGPNEALHAACATLEQGPATVAELAAIRLGLPVIDAALTQRYTPHMLNLERLGAVSFDKGCYPGQEVVTRTENLGSVKRRLRHFAAPTARVPARGAALLDADGQPAGEVIRAAPSATGIELLAVARLDAAALRIGDSLLISLD
jgi:folate-binding protein YgfZ